MAWKPLLALFAVALALPASAAAMPDTVSSDATFNGGVFDWTTRIFSDPVGNQPDTVSSLSLVFPQEFVFGGAAMPSCGQNQIDGQPTFPAACEAAQVGNGTGTAFAGNPGIALTNSVREDVTFRVVNGAPAGSTVLLVVTSAPSAPVAIFNRVIPGVISPADPPFAKTLELSIPQDLQSQLGLAIVFTDLHATVDDKRFLRLASCSGRVPLRQITRFKPSTGPGATTGTPDYTTTDSSVACDAASTTPAATTPEGSDGSPDAEPTIDVLVRRDSLRRVKPNRQGRVTVPGATFDCPSEASGRCTATMKLRAKRKVIGAALMNMSPGLTGPAVIQLDRAGRRLLAKRGKLPANADLKIVTTSGKSARVVVQLTLVKRG